MTATQATRPPEPETTAPAVRPLARPGAVLDLVMRSWIVVIAAVAAAIDVPVWARAPLAVAAVALVAVSFLSRYGRGRRLDGVIRLSGGAVALVALLGLLLNALPTGLTTASWGIGIGVLELIALVAFAAWRAPERRARAEGARRWRTRVPAALWTIAIGGVLAGALVWSTASFQDTHIAPLALGAERTGDTVEVTITSGSDVGPYELQLVDDDGTIERYAAGISVGPSTPRTFTFDLADGTRDSVRLVETGSTTPVRQLTFDTTSPTATTPGGTE